MRLRNSGSHCGMMTKCPHLQTKSRNPKDSSHFCFWCALTAKICDPLPFLVTTNHLASSSDATETQFLLGTKWFPFAQSNCSHRPFIRILQHQLFKYVCNHYYYYSRYKMWHTQLITVDICTINFIMLSIATLPDFNKNIISEFLL